MRLAVLSAGLRSPSSTRQLADELAAAVVERLGGDTPDVTHVEVRDHLHDIADHLLTGFPSEPLAAALRSVAEADAVIAVTPVFQASYSGAFKAFVDLVAESGLRGKPVLLGATGGSERHSLVIDHALRPLFAYLGALTVPTGVYAATSDFGAGAPQLTSRMSRAAGELAALLGSGWQQRPDPKPAAEGTDEDLADAQQALSKAAGRPVADFGDLLRSLGQA